MHCNLGRLREANFSHASTLNARRRCPLQRMGFHPPPPCVYTRNTATCLQIVLSGPGALTSIDIQANGPWMLTDLVMSRSPSLRTPMNPTLQFSTFYPSVSMPTFESKSECYMLRTNAQCSSPRTDDSRSLSRPLSLSTGTYWESSRISSP